MKRDNALANLELARIGPNCSNHAGKFMSEHRGLFDERKRAFAVENVAECDGAGSDLDENLAPLGEGDRDVAELKGAGGGGGGGQDDCAHELGEGRGQAWHCTVFARDTTSYILS